MPEISQQLHTELTRFLRKAAFLDLTIRDRVKADSLRIALGASVPLAPTAINLPRRFGESPSYDDDMRNAGRGDLLGDR